jgi:hypothetical protein
MSDLLNEMAAKVNGTDSEEELALLARVVREEIACELKEEANL